MGLDASAFAPHEGIAAIALPHLAGDPAHDLSHVLRVWDAAFAIVDADGLDVDREALAAAVLLHDCVDVAKDDPRRPMASRLSARRAAGILRGHLAPASLAAMAGAIEAHSFSAGLPLRTVEDAVLRDADRLDQLGAVGVARLFVVSGRMGRAMYDVADPTAERRPLDDVAYSLDHFKVKLLGLGDGFATRAGRAMARERSARTAAFLDDFLAEIAPRGPALSAPGPACG